MSYQKITVMGNIGKIEQRFSPSGDSVVNFSIAVSDKYKKKDGTQVDDVEWFNCVSFGKQSEVIAKYFAKGNQILVDGTMKTRQWQDNTGAKRYNTDLKVANFSFVDRKTDNAPAQAQRPVQSAIPKPRPEDNFVDDEVIPF